MLHLKRVLIYCWNYFNDKYASLLLRASATHTRFAIFQNAASHLSQSSCIHSSPHSADPESKPVSASPLFFHPHSQRLVGIHSRKVCLDIIAACSPSAGLKSRQPGQLRPCFREVLRKNCTRKKIPEMTIRLPGCRELFVGFRNEI